MTPRNTFCALLLTLPLLAITGCDNRTPTTSQINQTSQPDDSNLKRAVSEALQRDTLFAQSDIDVVAQRGQIKLTGKVATLQDKNRAADIVNKVDGVTSVSNNLEIVTPTGTN